MNESIIGNTNIKRSLVGVEAVIALSVMQLSEVDLKQAVNAASTKDVKAEIIQTIVAKVTATTFVGAFPFEFLYEEILNSQK